MVNNGEPNRRIAQHSASSIVGNRDIPIRPQIPEDSASEQPRSSADTGALMLHPEPRSPVGLSMLLDRCPCLRLDPAARPTFGVGAFGTTMFDPDSLNVLLS